MNQVAKNISSTVDTNGDASQSQYLDLLSSIATMTSHDPTGDAKCQPQQEHLKHHCAFTTTKTLKASTAGLRFQEKVGNVSKPLSRSRSTRNLHQNPDLSLSSPQLSSLGERESQLPHTSSRHKRSPSVSLPSIPCAMSIASTAPATQSIKFSSMITQKDDEKPVPVFGNDTELYSRPPETTEVVFAPAEIESETVTCSPDNICNNVYQSYEMQIPDSFPVGCILPNRNSNSNSNNNNHAEIKDTYNYDIFTFSPLQDPPRLPNAMESFVILEKAREEKNNWGWYA